jgi:hypothetical protein
MRIWKFRRRKNRVTLFVGPQEGTKQNIGYFILSDKEWVHFIDLFDDYVLEGKQVVFEEMK